MTKRERWTLLLIWVALGLLPLFFRPLWEPDEARYAEIPRFMLASGDWLTPRLNQVLYFEKPPFQYWVSALSMRLFGPSAWAARLPLALATGLVLWSSWRMARRLGAIVPTWAAFIAASSLLGFICGQILTLDALFSALIVTTLACAVEAVAARLENKPAFAWNLLAFAALALALLTKGLAAIVLVGGILVFALPFGWREPRLRRAIFRTLADPLGWVVFLALAVPWFVLVEQANPGHAQFFFIHEHFARFTSNVHARQGHANPVLDKLYFFLVLGVGMLPWLSLALLGFWRGLSFIRRRGPETPQGPLLRWTVAMMVMAVVWPMAFFTLSGSKLPTYILPAVMPLAVLGASFEEAQEAWRSLKRSGWELLAFGTILTVGLPLAIKDGSTPVTRTDPAALGWMLAMGLSFVGLGLWARRPKGLTGARWMVLLSAALLLFSLGAQRLNGDRKSVLHLVAKAPANAQWISHGNYFQGIAFATGRRTTVINGTGELRFGAENLSPGDRERWFQDDPLTLNTVAQRMALEDPARPVWAILDRDSWQTLPDSLKARWDVQARTPSAWLARFRGAGE